MYQYIAFALLLVLFSCQNNSTKEDPKAKEKIETEEKPAFIAYHTMDELLGKFNEKTHAEFAKIPAAYTDKSGIYLRKEALNAYTEMRSAAETSGIKLLIRSATRNFDYQKRIWEAKWNGLVKLSDGTFASDIKDPVARAKKILQYSSMPGTSRHHWGTDIDLNAFNNAYFEYGDGQKEFAWLTKNAATYGFYRPYTIKGPNRPEGYNEEKWHWSYLPIAKQFTDMAQHKLNDEMITGFDGEVAATKVNMVKNYILGIDPSCL